MTESSLKLAARGVVVGVLVSASVTASVGSAGVAAATCTSGQGSDAGAQCAPDETSFSIQLNGKSSVSAQGRLGSGTGKSALRVALPPTAEPRPAP